MVYMTAAASRFNRGMYISPQKLLSIMTGKANLRAGGFQQTIIRAVMYLVAGQTKSIGCRLMHGLLLAFLLNLLMTYKTLFRGILPKICPANHSMMKMTSLTIVFLHRFVNDSLFECGSHVGVTFHTAFSRLANRLTADAGNKQTKDERKSKK